MVFIYTMTGRNLDYGHMYEGKMIRKELDIITKNAKQLHDMLHDNDDLPEWVNKKIFIANNYIKSTKDYIHSKLHHGSHGKTKKHMSYELSEKVKQPDIVDTPIET